MWGKEQFKKPNARQLTQLEQKYLYLVSEWQERLFRGKFFTGSSFIVCDKTENGFSLLQLSYANKQVYIEVDVCIHGCMYTCTYAHTHFHLL